MPTLHLIPNRCKVPIVQLRIRGILHNFVVDTGATYTCVVPELLPALRDPRTRAATHCAANGEKVHNYDVECPFRFAGVALLYINISQTGHLLTPTLGLSCSGLIGQDLLRKFRSVTIDYVRNTITFTV